MRKRCEKIIQNSSKFKTIALHTRPCIVLPYERAEPRIVSHPVMAFFPKVSPRSVHNMLVHLLALPSANSSSLPSSSSSPHEDTEEAARRRRTNMPIEPLSPSLSGEQREERMISATFDIMDAALEDQGEGTRPEPTEKLSSTVDPFGVLVCGCGGTISELEECVRFGYLSCDRCGLCHSSFIDRGPPRTFFEDGDSKHYWQRVQEVGSQRSARYDQACYSKRREEEALVSWSKDTHHYATLAGLSVDKANEAREMLILLSFQQRISNSEVAIAAAIVAVSVTSWFATEQEEMSSKREREERFACRHCKSGHARLIDVRLCGMQTKRTKGRMMRYN